jgi:deazaflavin-dependent oxidoreductase (nitroreductase family)
MMNPEEPTKDIPSLVQNTGEPRQPSGLTRAFSRFPLLFYRLGLGRLLGWRFVRLVHVGRKSGRQRHVVLEVVDVDRAAGRVYVASGWGERSDWVRNITANPAVQVQIAGQGWPARARRLTQEESADLLMRYGRKHPAALQGLARVMGYRIQRSEAAYRALGERIPTFVFEKAET